MMKDWDERYPTVVSLNIDVSRTIDYLHFEKAERLPLIPITAESGMFDYSRSTYRAELIRVVRFRDRKREELRMFLDEEAQELVDLFVELEHNSMQGIIGSYRDSNAILVKHNELLMSEIDNFITWKNVKAYFKRRFK